SDENEDTTVFEITDFTTASDWERFIARLEEVIHEWKLTNQPVKPHLQRDEIANGTWDEISESASFADFKCKINYHFLLQENENVNDGADCEKEKAEEKQDQEDVLPTAMQDLISMDNDFPPRAHCLSRWFGIREFLVINPEDIADAVIGESKCNILLSSICIALNNTNCQVPMFVQVHERWRKLYQGICEGPGIRTEFEMVHLKKTPKQCRHLSGLSKLFTDKVGCTSSTVKASVRFTYVVPYHNVWHRDSDFDTSLGGDHYRFPTFTDLPFGASEDPISELHLAVTWPSLAVEMISDNEVVSDLDPSRAPQWSLRVRMNKEPQCLLSQCLSEFASICHRNETQGELLGIPSDTEDGFTESDIGQALQKLTEPEISVPLPSVTHVMKQARRGIRKRVVEKAPLKPDMLNELLDFLFPDAVDPTYMDRQAAEAGRDDIENKDEREGMKEIFKSLKSAPPYCLTFKLAICLCHISHHFSSCTSSAVALRAIAQIWHEFVLELRYRWEHNYGIPDVEAGSPNMAHSLLHQKLQMLSCCVQKKRKHAEDSLRGSSNSTGTEGATTATSLSHNSSRVRLSPPACQSDDDDEFYECEDMPSDPIVVSMSPSEGPESISDEGPACDPCEGGNNNVISSTATSWSGEALAENADSTSERCSPDTILAEAEGRLRPCSDLKLLRVTDEPLYIPITQEPAPLTEDMLEEQAEVMARLGTTAEGAHLRARMQSNCLLSDMEAFKAANPGCVLEDFVRWYSPRDYCTEEGKLSSRMQIPGNLWQEVWETAKPVPARRQKRLFDDIKEAEKVLHFLAGLRPSQVALYMMPIVIHVALVRISELGDEGLIPTFQKSLQEIGKKAIRLARAPRLDILKYEELLAHITLLEMSMEQAMALRDRLFSDETVAATMHGNRQLEKQTREVEQLLLALQEQPEVAVPGASRSYTGSILLHLFDRAQKQAAGQSSPDDCAHPGSRHSFPEPAAREYILRTVAPRPAPYSRPTPQKMYCVILNEDFRLASAVSQDTMFQ
ncbi:PREDICTED: rab3 GTPase-activating protein catalytic subunit-like, partial [Priapulus caudatus]|uniref:Rab3 GTPase-activating protein catalytic subunit n=1 Tax=Priapulus caudatus TaxID=37621 RepID=A0ABM1EUZ0_PRICU